MDCPECSGKLEDHTIENLDVYCCFVCEGLWFDAGKLEEVIKRDAHDFDFIDVGQEEYEGAAEKATGIDLHKKLGKCPRCGITMAQKPYKHKLCVIIDVCPKGDGVWLDGGEIQSLRRRGLVVLHDHLAYNKEMFRTIFSKEGFRDVIRKGREVLKDRLEGIDPKQDPKL